MSILDDELFKKAQKSWLEGFAVLAWRTERGTEAILSVRSDGPQPLVIYGILSNDEVQQVQTWFENQVFGEAT